MDYKITEATRADAPFIAQAVMTAIGYELQLEMAETPDRLPLLSELFTRLAASESSQYSYRNTLIAVTPDGRRIGAVVSYDGSRLHALRHAFVAEANNLLGWNLEEADMDDETSADEFYLDSLMVLPEFRRSGVGAALIEAVAGRAHNAGKPLGLLVDFENERARRLYESLQFRPAGERRFAGRLMAHMMRN